MLLADGVRVWGTAREVARLAHFSAVNLSSAQSPNFSPVAMDLRDGAQAEAVFREADRAANGFDLVINSAGYGVFGEFAVADFSIWQEQLEVMLINTARLSQV